MKLKYWLGLIICNAAWAINPAVSKLLVQEIEPHFAAWLRYFSAFIFFWIYVCFRILLGKFTIPKLSIPLISPSQVQLNTSSAQTKKFALTQWIARPRSRTDLLILLAMGSTTCFISPLTQMFGLSISSAVNNSILIMLEPLITTFLAWLFLKERLGKNNIIAFILAILGFILISLFPQLNSVQELKLSANFGDFTFLIAVIGEAFYSVFAKSLGTRYSPSAIFGTVVGIGALLLSLAILPIYGFPHLTLLTAYGWMEIFWLGAIGTTLTYLYWIYIISVGAPFSSVALTLFLQPLLGAIVGTVYLKEPFGSSQMMGAALVLAGVVFQMKTEATHEKDSKHLVLAKS